MGVRLETPGRTWFLFREDILRKRLTDALNRKGLYPTVPHWLRHSRISAKRQELLRQNAVGSYSIPYWMAHWTATNLVDCEIQMEEMRKLYDLPD
jgi:hypothetical protein